MPEFVLNTEGAIQCDARTKFEDTRWLDLDYFTRGYIEALFFTECDTADREDWNPETGSSLPADVGFSDLAPETLADILADCAAFQRDNASDLAAAVEAGRPLDHCGHDFWLTRNGHGAGFWDRSELEADGLGDRLTDAAKGFGETWATFGDDGRVYLS